MCFGPGTRFHCSRGYAKSVDLVVQIQKCRSSSSSSSATLNVRTLTQAGSLEALKMDLAQYKLDILGVQETRLQEQLPHACFPAKYKMFSETSLKT